MPATRQIQRAERPVPYLLLVSMSICVLLAVGCGEGSGGRGERWNVVLVMVDTLRADHLSLLGHDRATSPELDAFAEEAYVFPVTQSQAGCTYPSVNSLLTSKYPAHFDHAAGGGVSFAIPPEIPSLAEILREAGYDTAAVSASSIVRATPSKANREGGFGAGFRIFDEECLELDAGCVNAQTLPLLGGPHPADDPDGLDEPFFLYLHYWDPHGPYEPPIHHVRAFPDPGEASYPFIERGNLWPINRMLYADGPQWELNDVDVAQLKTNYDEEIRFWDRHFGQLVGWLRDRELLERTILVVVSDHGEEILDHDLIGHCRNMAYQTLLRTPMVVRIPGTDGGLRQAKVQNLDVVPTLLDYLGLPDDEYGFEGRSLRPVIESDREVNRYLFSAQGKNRAVTDGRYKLIYEIETGERKLYDLADDPAEIHDLASTDPTTADRLEDVLFGWIRHLEGAVGSDEAIRRAREIEEELKAVGYL